MVLFGIIILFTVLDTKKPHLNPPSVQTEISVVSVKEIIVKRNFVFCPTNIIWTQMTDSDTYLGQRIILRGFYHFEFV